MSDAGDDIPVDAAPEVEVTAEVATEAPKGKLTVEEALQVRSAQLDCHWRILTIYSASFEKCSCP